MGSQKNNDTEFVETTHTSSSKTLYLYWDIGLGGITYEISYIHHSCGYQQTNEIFL